MVFVFIIAQLFRPEKNSGDIKSIDFFLNSTDPPENVRVILKNTCFDCHSDHTVYPWYNNITPINYWISKHIDDGKKHFNISQSQWSTASLKKKDHKFDELIEMIPLKASAGYAAGYADPDYIKVLPTFHLPFLSKDRKYRSFPIKGDSMPPVVEGSYVVAEFIQNWMSIRSGTPCIVITKDDGIVFKVVHNLLKSEQALQLCSTNTFYEPYTAI